jgi:flagellar biosynthesis/type III secretory pathway M-ring protein FliF/YscJ
MGTDSYTMDTVFWTWFTDILRKFDRTDYNQNGQIRDLKEQVNELSDTVSTLLGWLVICVFLIIGLVITLYIVHRDQKSQNTEITNLRSAVKELREMTTSHTVRLDQHDRSFGEHNDRLREQLKNLKRIEKRVDGGSVIGTQKTDGESQSATETDGDGTSKE